MRGVGEPAAPIAFAHHPDAWDTATKRIAHLDRAARIRQDADLVHAEVVVFGRRPVTSSRCVASIVA